MDLRSRFSEVDEGGRRYRLTKMDARTGSWLFMFLMGKATGGLEGVTRLQISTALQKCSKEEFELVQYELLRRTELLTDNPEGDPIPVPVVNNSKVIVDRELADDAPTCLNLTLEGIMLNVNPFFASASSPSSAQKV